MYMNTMEDDRNSQMAIIPEVFRELAEGGYGL